MISPLQDLAVEHPRDGAAVVVFSGEHDVATAEAVHSTLESLVEQNELVVADFSEAEFVDSATLHALVRAARRAKERGTCFRVQLGTAAIVERAFALSAGATPILEPTLQPWGDRVAGFHDPFDNRWWVATRINKINK